MLRRVWAGTLVWAAAGWLAAAPLSPEEEAGRQIYQQGASPSGDTIMARVGMGPFEVPGAAVACGNCHGPDGLGRPEGGVDPSVIVWSELTKSYGHTHTDGRKHPAFDEASMRRSVLYGTDPAGNQLDPAMPRYRMSEVDLRALVAYVKKLESQRDPGVGADAVRIGTLLPMSGRLSEIGRGTKGVIEAYLDSVNRSGGVFGRRVELVVADYADTSDAALANARELMQKGDVFALVAPFVPKLEGDLGRLAEEARIPIVGPITLFPEDAHNANPYVFHLLAGVSELAQVLARYGAADPEIRDGSVVLLHPGAALALADAVADALKALGYRSVSRVAFRAGEFDAPGIARELQRKGAQAVWILGVGADVTALARESAKLGAYPHLMIPGSLMPRDILSLPPQFQDRVHLAYPTLPADQNPEAVRGYAALLDNRQLPRSLGPMQMSAFCSALLAVEILKRVGRDLTRQKFVASLESLQNFSTGLLPGLSYNAGRRIGALGGYVVSADLKQKAFRPSGGWIALEGR